MFQGYLCVTYKYISFLTGRGSPCLWGGEKPSGRELLQEQIQHNFLQRWYNKQKSEGHDGITNEML